MIVLELPHIDFQIIDEVFNFVEVVYCFFAPEFVVYAIQGLLTSIMYTAIILVPP